MPPHQHKLLYFLCLATMVLLSICKQATGFTGSMLLGPKRGGRTREALKMVVSSFDLIGKQPRPSLSTASYNKNENYDSDSSLILDPLVICGPSGVGKGTTDLLICIGTLPCCFDFNFAYLLFLCSFLFIFFIPLHRYNHPALPGRV